MKYDYVDSGDRFQRSGGDATYVKLGKASGCAKNEQTDETVYPSPDEEVKVL